MGAVTIFFYPEQSEGTLWCANALLLFEKYKPRIVSYGRYFKNISEWPWRLTRIDAARMAYVASSPVQYVTVVDALGETVWLHANSATVRTTIRSRTVWFAAFVALATFLFFLRLWRWRLTLSFSM